jgi:hypothetical protein
MLVVSVLDLLASLINHKMAKIESQMFSAFISAIEAFFCGEVTGIKYAKEYHK